MEICALYDLAEQENIEVIPFPMGINESMSVMDADGSCYIGMDESVKKCSTQERVHLIHEIGHCVTGSFYNRYATVDCRQRHENRADKWAVQQLIPASELDIAIAEGCTELWELAERFDVTEDFMRKAVCYHVHGNVAAELYF